jgi:hypothetical protein
MTGKNRQRMKPCKGLFSFVVLVFMTVIYGCERSDELKKFIKPNFNPYSISKMVILPIENYTSDKHAGKKIKALLTIDLLSRNIDVIEPGEVMIVLRELKIRSVSSVTGKDIKKIGEILRSDAVMIGSVGTFQVSRGISASYPEVSLSLRLFDSKTGSIVWSIWDTTGGADFWTRHFGAEGVTLDETAKKIIKETIDTLFEI